MAAAFRRGRRIFIGPCLNLDDTAEAWYLFSRRKGEGWRVVAWAYLVRVPDFSRQHETRKGDQDDLSSVTTQGRDFYFGDEVKKSQSLENRIRKITPIKVSRIFKYEKRNLFIALTLYS